MPSALEPPSGMTYGRRPRWEPPRNDVWALARPASSQDFRARRRNARAPPSSRPSDTCARHAGQVLPRRAPGARKQHPVRPRGHKEVGGGKVRLGAGVRVRRISQGFRRSGNTRSSPQAKASSRCGDRDPRKARNSGAEEPTEWHGEARLASPSRRDRRSSKFTA